MATTTTTTVITKQGDTVDLVATRQYGSGDGAAMVPAILTLNLGLAGLGPILPVGTAVTLPAAATTQSSQDIKLWD